MATGNANFDTLATSVKNAIGTKVEDNIYKKIILLKTLKDKSNITKDGGNKIVEPLMYGENSTVKGISGYDSVDITPSAGFTNVEYDWKELVGSMSISNVELAKNAGKNQVFNLLKGKEKQLMLSTQKKMNTILLGDGTGVGTGYDASEAGKIMNGIQTLVGGYNNYDTSNGSEAVGPTTVGNIDWTITANAFWRSYVDNPSATRAWTAARWKHAYHKIGEESGDSPDLIYTTLYLYELYEETIAPLLRFKPQDISGNGDVMFAGLELGGAKVFWDQAYAHDGTAGSKTYFLNTDYIKLVTHSQYWMKMSDFIFVPDKVARWAQLYSMGQLITSNRRQHGIVTRQT